MAARNAANVLPEPVGAASNTSRPAAMAGHACACAGVGAGKAPLNQAHTAKWNVEMACIGNIIWAFRGFRAIKRAKDCATRASVRSRPWPLLYLVAEPGGSC